MRRKLVVGIGLSLACVMLGGAAEAPTDRAFTLAVISEGAPASADVFFAVLADAPHVALVERDELDRIMREAKLASLAGVDAVKIGQLTKADALVFVRKSNKQLFVRLVETARGVRLFEVVGDPSAQGAEKLARVVRRQLEKRSDLLASAPGDRQYVAVDPLVIKKVRRWDRHPQFAHLSDILAVTLSARPDLICLEREALEHVGFENGLDAQSQSNALTQADWLLRGVCDVKNKTTASVTLQLQLLANGSKQYSAPFEVTVDGFGRNVSAMLAWVAGVMDVDVSDVADMDRSGEAETQYMLGNVYSARGLRANALRCFRVAHMLNPDEVSYAWTLARTLVGTIDVRTKRLTKMQEMIEAMDICQSAGLREKCCFDDAHWRNLEPFHPLPLLLQSVPANMTDSDRDLVSLFRKRLRGYMEWLYGYEPGVGLERGLHSLQVMSPFFFDDPGPAMAYRRALLQFGGCDWYRIDRENFLAVKYWDRARAKVLWVDFLGHIRDTYTGTSILEQKAKYCVLRAIAQVTGGYGSDPSPAGKQAMLDYFTWLLDPAGRNGDTYNWKCFHLWRGFANMDADFKRKNLGRLMTPGVLNRSKDHAAMFTVLEQILDAYPSDTDVRGEIEGHVSTFLRIWVARGPHYHAKVVERLRTRPRLLALAKREDLAQREGVILESDHIELVFDYLKDIPKEYQSSPDIARYRFLMDPPYAWLSWGSGKGLLFVQFDLRSRTSKVYTVWARYSCTHKALLRWHDTLCLVAYGAVWAVPYDPVSETLLADQAAKIRGLPPIGVKLADVTRVIPGREYLYVGLTPGVLYRWKPGMEAAQLMIRHDSLSPGPLNDTNPYRVTNGRYNAELQAMEFHIASSRDEPKQGWWRNTPGTQPEWQWIAETGPPPERVLPAWRANSHQTLLKSDFDYLSTSGKVTTLARARGHIRSSAGWCEEAALWVVQNDSKTFEGPMRMYMIEREHWPEPVAPAATARK